MYTISATLSPSGVLTNYEVTYNTAQFTIAKRPASVTPTAATKTYGDPDPTLTGLLTADAVTATYSRTAGETVLGGPYPITATLSPSSVLGNYEVTYGTAQLTVTKRKASVTPNAASKVYGDLDPAFTGTLAGFVAADNVSATYARTAGETVAGGPYTISATLSPGTVLSNYNVVSNTAEFTIVAKGASVTPNPASKVYGDSDPAFSGTLSGFLNADNVTATYTRTSGETVAGTYTISASLSPGSVLTNYNISYNTAPFTILKRDAAVTPSPATKVYGDSDPAFSGTVTGFLASDNVTATYARTAGETVSNTGYAISGTLAPVGVLGNYNITYNTAPFTIKTRAASVNPNAAGKTYGDADPALSGTLAGFLPADNVVASYSRTPGETVAGGPYTISATLSPAAVLSNYSITSNTAQFTICARAASVTPNPATKTYGDADPGLTGSLTGFLAADGVTATYTRTAGETASATPYTISATLSPAGVLGNYNISYNTAEFTITKKAASVTPDPATKTYGDADPGLTGSLTGFLPADGVTASYTRTAGETVSATPYTISATLSPAGVRGNYNITYNTAQFTITKEAASVTPDAGSKIYGHPDLILTGTQTGFLAADNVTATYSRAAGETVNGGPYTISAILSPSAVLSNYNITSNTAQFTITPRAASATPNPATKVYGTADPVLTGTLTGFLSADNVTATYARNPGETVAGGPYTLSATLIPAAVLGNYNISYNTALFTITPATPVITWNPAQVVYGAPLGASQLKATTTVPGSWSYTPAAGTVLTPGSHTLSVTFTPTNNSDYTTATNPAPVNVQYSLNTCLGIWGTLSCSQSMQMVRVRSNKAARFRQSSASVIQR